MSCYWIIAFILHGLIMYLWGENKGYIKGYNEAIKEFNERYNIGYRCK